MTEASLRIVLARLAAQEAELARLRRKVAVVERRSRRSWRAILAVVGLALLAAVPLGTLAADPFDDLDPAQASGHNPNIALIAAAGITRGCNPPIYTSYCPKDAVTREQMASFLARVAGLGGNPPVANAAKLGGYAANGLTRVAFAANPNDIVVPAADTDVVSATLEVPLQGYVLVQFTGYWYAQRDNGCPCTTKAFLRMDNGAGQRVTEQDLNDDGAVNFDRENASGSYVFLAPAGIHTFTLQARRSNPSGSTAINMGLSAVSLQAILLPFGASGVVATDVPAPATTPPGSSSDDR